MFGFRSHLPTQDVMLQIKEDIFDKFSCTTTQVVLARDMKGAFDNVSHTLVLKNLFLDWVRALDSILMGTIPVPSKGTSQGSPPPLLERIPRMNHNLYEDDLTIWATSGSDGEKQDFIKGGRQSPSKEADIRLTFKDGTPVPVVERVRILDLHLQRDGGAKYTVDRLVETTTQVMHIMNRIMSHGHRLKEPDLIWLTALVVSRITYTRLRKGKMDVIICKVYKLALGVPPHATNAKLLRLGWNNTFQELIDAHLASQRERLALTRIGRHVPRSLGIPIPASQRRWTAQCKDMRWSYGKWDDVFYTNVALYTGHAAAAMSGIDSDLDTVVTASVCTIQPVMAEEVGIAMAIVSPTKTEHGAIRQFREGRISPQAFCILRKSPKIPSVEVGWTRGYKFVDGNRQVHAVARACIFRVPSSEDKQHPVPNQYSEIVAYLRGRRHLFTPPDRSLSREQAAAWRQTQTVTYTHLVNVYRFYPDRYPDWCPHCGETREAELLVWSAQDERQQVERARLAEKSTGALQ
ncbi:hypothetical protein HPB47_018811 [Ixodes persulcatus]|uniref:Uncharacterized protein n=1 Tax=Ixodes persulcatus TaxID=34615 RepID=A0AC60QJR7_IXOPE|nr:hypothetical protein HPB47_018811 [Ixodes persulcatus]